MTEAKSRLLLCLDPPIFGISLVSASDVLRAFAVASLICSLYPRTLSSIFVLLLGYRHRLRQTLACRIPSLLSV